jgi:hypothetical protein
VRRPWNPRQEAYERLAGRYDVRVLEPSPPAVAEPPWFAEDPVARGSGSSPVVSPVSTGDLLWDDLAREDRSLAPFCSERWLGAYARLAAPPPRLPATRRSLHLVAQHVMSPTRQRAPGEKIGLRWTRGGFGTPFFGNDVQLRVAGDVLTVQVGTREQRGRLTTLKDAAEFVGFDLTRFDTAMADEPLEIDAVAGAYLGDLFGFGASVLEQLRAEATAGRQPSRVQLWPEHFDIAVELGDESTGQRATYGVSPGDDDHDEPYLYVAPWSPRDPSALWNATAFAGAELPLAATLDAADQREAALEFLRHRVRELSSAPSA